MKIKVNGCEIPIEEEALTVRAILGKALIFSAIPNNRFIEQWILQGYKGVYQMEDMVDLTQEQDFITLPNGPTPVADLYGRGFGVISLGFKNPLTRRISIDTLDSITDEVGYIIESFQDADVEDADLVSDLEILMESSNRLYRNIIDWYEKAYDTNK